jgi:maltooligosyltrehalose trehalohydrolase
MEVIGDEKTKLLYVRRWNEGSQVIIVYNFNDQKSSMIFPVPAGRWIKLFDSAQKRWLGKSSQVAREFVSHGDMQLTLQPNSCVLCSSNSGTPL